MSSYPTIDPEDIPESTRQRFEEITLEAVRLGVSKQVGLDCLHSWNLSVERTAKSLGQRLTVELATFVLSKPLEKVEARYPATWWDAVKERFGPQWFLKRWPARYTTIVLRAEAYFPQLSAIVPGQTGILKLHRSEPLSF